MSTTTSTDPAAQLALARRILNMALATHRKLAPQVIDVVRALKAAGVPAGGGFSDADLAAPPSLKSAKVVEMLQGTFQEDAAVAARVDQVVARFQQAGATLGATEAGLAADAVSPEQLDDLQRAALFLGKFHEAVKGDPLLVQLFPPPQVLIADEADAI